MFAQNPHDTDQIEPAAIDVIVPVQAVAACRPDRLRQVLTLRRDGKFVTHDKVGFRLERFENRQDRQAVQQLTLCNAFVWLPSTTTMSPGIDFRIRRFAATDRRKIERSCLPLSVDLAENRDPARIAVLGDTACLRDRLHQGH